MENNQNHGQRSATANHHRFAHKAMNTVFEAIIDHPDETSAGQAAQAAFSELDRLELELSRFIPNSDISRINNLQQFQSTIVSADTFQCLADCSNLYQLTRGAFDISSGPLIDLWKNRPAGHAPPSSAEVGQALAFCGLPWLQLDEESHSVQLMNRSIRLDLGGYGKGYGLEVMKQMLLDWDMEHFLLHGGQSTVLACSREDSHDWPLSLHTPQGLLLGTIRLKNRALSSSGLQKGTHIVDPRSGRPVAARRTCWVLTADAGHADALSTALMVMSDQEIEELIKEIPGTSGLMVEADAAGRRQPVIKKFGDWSDLMPPDKI